MESESRRVALVTGGASGLGRAIARRLAAAGATVVITDIQYDLGRAAAVEDGLFFLEQNVCEEAVWARVIGDIEGRFRHLNVLVNSAGILGSLEAASPEDTSLSSWRQIFSTNVESVFLGCKSAIPAMRRAGGGCIINLASIADRLATPYATAYGASKAAVRQLTRSVAQHCVERGLNIRCNSVHPGVVRTPLLERTIEESAKRRGIPTSRVISEYKSSIPFGDFTRPEDIAAAVAFLASEDSRHITGSELIVDGGIVNCNTYRRDET